MTSTERGSYNKRGSYKCDGIPMDPLITTAARALAAGDPLGALKRVALRDDPPPSDSQSAAPRAASVSLRDTTFGG